MATITKQQKTPHVAIVPTPGIGHLVPLVELAKRLVLRHNFLVTLLIPTDGSPMIQHKAFLEALPNSISSIFLPPVNLDDLPEDVKIETRIALTLTRSLPALRDSFKVLAESTRLVAAVVDLLALEVFDVAKEFGISSYIFFCTTAMALSFVFHLPELDETFTCEFRDLPEPIKLPGCVPIHGSDLADGFQDRKNEVYKAILQMAKQYPLAAGIMVNSFLDLEPGCFKALMEGKEGWPPVYPVGPLVQSGSDMNAVEGSECLRWLDKQPNSSVLFVSFGSGGTLSHEQLNELALGLEMSGQRFLWVVRSPHEKAANANYFSVQSIKDPFPFLPDGFLERTKEVGLVVPSWAPQVQILKHASTGGFLFHCGWNSTLESILHGVPLIALPLYADQRVSSVLLADDLKVAFRVKVNDKGLVGHKDIANYARGIIEGEEGKLLKSKMKALKNAAERALSQDGSSTKSLAEVAQIWMSHKE
ncbi:hydroquinone glucosyltransferase-like [Corylus avellana]|uniref:hydroquinone glucosyltransferase-like n=1 Tax=Corylus avellana TaxID=13451 RepID=UPI00286CA5D9|nr:hydroquinone glucosyltransferase-like [Corylus avellana]